ncbi:non-canonical purine NTP pyrophosphatase [Lacticaseibacillus baoqingensis]|uniref:Non-canonical purine NTP pyrophosphatase n=1 Tax=Lacticaseibacillus baoqingensis TaxID=2486013 RepID=A0ABW4E4Z8_9LACO|nr:non-canonical purine NTP pyrophosphatase [Lacticaseibacillus baoqingensis]
MTQFIMATHNAGKLAEVKAILASYGHEVIGFGKDLPPEGDDLAQNALVKAQTVHAADPKAWVIGDDSGLWLAAYPKRLGVHTARQLPRTGTNAAVLAMLEPSDSRQATLVSTMVLLAPSGSWQVATSRLEATVAIAASGADGTGFDQILIPQGAGVTLAALPLVLRQRYLPRQQALAELLR